MLKLMDVEELILKSVSITIPSTTYPIQEGWQKVELDLRNDSLFQVDRVLIMFLSDDVRITGAALTINLCT